MRQLLRRPVPLSWVWPGLFPYGWIEIKRYRQSVALDFLELPLYLHLNKQYMYSVDKVVLDIQVCSLHSTALPYKPSKVFRCLVFGAK